MTLTKSQRNTEIVNMNMEEMSQPEISEWAWANMNKAEAAYALIDAYQHKQHSKWSEKVYAMLQNGTTRQQLEDYLI